MTQTPLSPRPAVTDARPDALGRFGQFGGKYVPETLMPALFELEKAFYQYRDEADFKAELDGLLKDYVGRATPLYFAERLTSHYRRPDGSGPDIYLKREDLNHTGAHKINNALGQVLLARYLKLGKVAQFFSSLIFVFNTYYLILVDGGQVGIALSYGLSPLIFLFLKNILILFC